MANDDELKRLAKAVSDLAGTVISTADVAIETYGEVQRQGRTLDNIEKICDVLRHQNLEMSRQIKRLAKDE